MRVVVHTGDECPIELGSMDAVPVVGDVLEWCYLANSHDHTGQSMAVARGTVISRVFRQEPMRNYGGHFGGTLSMPFEHQYTEWVCTLMVESKALQTSP